MGVESNVMVVYFKKWGNYMSDCQQSVTMTWLEFPTFSLETGAKLLEHHNANFCIPNCDGFNSDLILYIVCLLLKHEHYL